MSAPNSSAPIFSARAIDKRFGATVALSHLDFSIGAGEVVALMGANGAGKSTFVKIVSGVQGADAGAMQLDGQRYAPASPLAARQLGVATVHQSIADAVVPASSIADNLLLDELCGGAQSWWTPRATRRERARELAARVGLDADLDAPLGTLALAAQQRVVLARALATRPRLLILDEPTASLSAAEAARLHALVDTLRDEGVAVLLVSHRLADLRRLATRVAVLRDGRVVSQQSAPVDFDAALETMIGRPLPPPRIDSYDELNNGEAILQLRQLRLTDRTAAFDLDVRDGEIVAVVGPVGAGKSRLAQTIFGATRAFAGEMRLDGAPWRPRTPGDAIRAGVFLAGEDRWRTSLFPDAVPFASIAGTIGFPFLSRWSRGAFVARERERAAARAAIDAFGIRCAGPDDRLPRLSGGNQQKVLLARWHAEPARVLLLDEPFQGVDAGARADIAATLRREAPGRATLVLVSDLEEAHEVADRIVYFDRGALDLGALETADPFEASHPAEAIESQSTH
ncbi:Monosaccharide ABC transporter ATP-binding protein (CUT2 family) [Paraburkholderia tropica]|uniref:sugar ABC transporter ATP-binding protein n=1 Tax=Paraburkholderia tropica TaxID=92647 RepID=UPI001CB29938|nr:sugar ABC transporter ATP-binding protein [Paraburkholderia tropica]CAG9214294.1 Monosaccharide ABC transporter ATP-binding protein (CUT2 family) [Paraburkholderia tropica]